MIIFLKIFFLIIITMILGIFFLTPDMSTFPGMISNIQKSEMVINYYGLLFYCILLIFSLYYFILKDKKPILDAFLLGVAINGIAESTNYTIFKEWDISFVIFDLIGGGLFFAAVTFIFYRLKI